MTATVFVDTNVLVYARDAGEPEKQPRAAEWVAHLWRSAGGRLSFQVLHEYYVTVTRKLEPGLERKAARNDVRSFLAWRPVPASEPVLEGAWALEEEGGLSWWDALIVAAAQEAGCGILLSEDLQDGREFEGLRVLNPFLHAPAKASGR